MVIQTKKARRAPAGYSNYQPHIIMKKTLTTMALAAALLPGMALADSSDPQEDILTAARNGETQLTQLIASGTSVDATDEDGETALMRASDEGLSGAVQLLIKHGADVNRKDEDGRTPLMFAADEGHTEVVKELISAGADVNARDEDGETALKKAEDEDHVDTAAVLRAAGAR